jgi:hypothetical protein
LAVDSTLAYKILSKDEIPDDPRCRDNCDDCIKTLVLPAGTAVRFGRYQRLISAVLGGEMSLPHAHFLPKSTVQFSEIHTVRRVSADKSGNRFGSYVAAAGSVDLYASGAPQQITLAAASSYGDTKLSAGSVLKLYENGKIETMTLPASGFLRFGNRNFVGSLSFYKNGNVKVGTLVDGEVYGGIRIAGFDQCQAVVGHDAEEACRTEFYSDGTSIKRAPSALTQNVGELTVLAGQKVEFDEEGHWVR